MNQTEALVYRAHNATNPRVVDIAPALGDDPYALETYGLGQTIGMNLTFSKAPALISRVQVYHDDDLLVDSGSFLSGGSAALSFRPAEAGIHTFTTVVTYLADGQPMLTSDYWAAVVTPEPCTALMLALGSAGFLVRRRKAVGKHDQSM